MAQIAHSPIKKLSISLDYFVVWGRSAPSTFEARQVFWWIETAFGHEFCPHLRKSCESELRCSVPGNGNLGGPNFYSGPENSY